MLYRKYRPVTFDEVKGQDHIVKTLKNQIISGRIGHAYLFCGTRGTGKTTVAKVFAKAVNCENPVNGNPCGECDSCKAIADESAMNVIEIDAASNNGVENIRQIREEVSYRPTQGRYKVYIIDEVHMLSTGAFNALLKTLEEPPEYVIFILATTDVHKIPVTILSRCQRYDFRRISAGTIKDRLTDLLAQENAEAEEKAIKYIAEAADGSMRDALSLLDRVLQPGEKLTYNSVLDAIGASDEEIFSRMMTAIEEKNTVDVLNVVDDALEKSETEQFVTDFIRYLRNRLFEENSQDILEKIRVFAELERQMKYTSQKRVILEAELIQLCCGTQERQRVPDNVQERVPDNVQERVPDWDKIIREVPGFGGVFLRKTTPIAVQDYIILKCETKMGREYLNSHPEIIKSISEKTGNKQIVF